MPCVAELLERIRKAMGIAPPVGEAMSLAPYSRASTTALAVAEIAARQWGVISRAQLIECGVSGSVISRWVRDGRLHRLYPGVYAVGHHSIPYEGRLTAALFAAGHGSALSDETGTHWWELTENPPEKIHISVPTRRRSPGGDVCLHHPRELEVVRHKRLPVTPVPDSLVAYAATTSVREMRKALAQADFRQCFNATAIRRAARQGRPGSRRLVQALDRHLPQLAFAANELEVEFILLCEKFGLPIPRVNVWIGSKKVDAFWPEAGLVVELDSRSAHGSAPRTLADHQRDLELRRLGYVVRRYSWFQVFQRAPEVMVDLCEALSLTPTLYKPMSLAPDPRA